MDYIPYTPQNEEEFFQQLEQWNDEDEYTRCIQALNAIPEDWRNYRTAYALSLIHIYFFGVSIAYDPYMREVVKAEQFTTCGGDGGRSICGGLGIFLGFLPCSPHCKPEVQEDKELNGDYDFYRPMIRVEMDR